MAANFFQRFSSARPRREEAVSTTPMRLKIYSAHHARPLFAASHALFVPLWGGGEPCTDASYETDSKIPRKSTVGYNETALHYYVWKHELDDLDYVGFEHYRRMILFPSLFDGVEELAVPTVPDGWWFAYADEPSFVRLLEARANAAPERIDALKAFLSRHDLVLPLPSATETLKEQWIWCQYGIETLDKLVTCIKSAAAYRANPFKIDVDVKKAYFCNIFVMKTALFRAYMELWEQVMFALHNEIDFTSRMPAYASERLFSMYFLAQIEAQNLKVAEIPFAVCQARKAAHQTA